MASASLYFLQFWNMHPADAGRLTLAQFLAMNHLGDKILAARTGPS